MMHGEPTWSYLYRNMIGPAVEAGFRVVAPDRIGLGRSDKPLDRSAYSYAAQVAWMRAWIEALDLRNMILACQDWGSLIGLRLVAEMPDRFARSEEHTSELQSLMRISYAVFCLKKKQTNLHTK